MTMKTTERMAATVYNKNLIRQVALLYERYPNLRGRSRNYLVNEAWRKFIKDMLPDQTEKGVFHNLISSISSFRGGQLNF